MVMSHSVYFCSVFAIPVHNKVTALCKEKWDWLTLHSDVSAEQIQSYLDYPD